MILLCCICSSCGASQGEIFLGFWQQVNKDNSYLHIKKNGAGFITIIYEPSMVNGDIEKIEYPAIFENKSLIIKVPFGNIPVIFNKNNATIILGGKDKYKKINQDLALEKIQKIMDSQKQTNELCNSLQQEIKEKRKQITDKKEWNNYLDHFHSRVPKGCTIIGDGRSTLDLIF